MWCGVAHMRSETAHGASDDGRRASRKSWMHEPDLASLAIAARNRRHTFHTDSLRTRQVLLNLMGNACTVTANGTVTMRARLELADGLAWLVVEVSDTGLGMTPAPMEHLFDEFVQADVTTTWRFGGTGLGLTLSQRVCRLMGGTLTAQSAEGKGSTFRVRLPEAAMTAAAPAAVAPRRPLRACRGPGTTARCGPDTCRARSASPTRAISPNAPPTAP